MDLSDGLSGGTAAAGVTSSAAPRTGARLRLVRPDDLPAVWRFCARSYDKYRGCSLQDFRDVWDHHWLRNPAMTPEYPLGWVVETPELEIVGFSGLVPMRLKVGSDSVTALCGADWFIRPDHRSLSLTAFRQYAALGARHLMLSTGLSPAAARIHARTRMGMETIPVGGIDQRLWWIVDARQFLAWKVDQLGAASALWKALAAAPALGALSAPWPAVLGIWTDPKGRVLPWLARSKIAFDCEPLPVERVTSFTDEFDGFWSDHRERYDVTVERTSKFLNWRHVLLPKTTGEAFVLACRDRGRLMGYVALQTSGYHGRLPGCFIVTDLFYPTEREDVFRNLMNAAFRLVVERRGAILKLSGFHPKVYAALATQRPHVIDPDAVRKLARGRLGRGILGGFGYGGKRRPGGQRPADGSYWYKAPTAELARICRGGSWWPTGIDGTTHL
jgi:hypothetical protein